MERLGWDDLLIEDLSAGDWQRWLALWNWAVSGRLAPAFLNKFGSWFLRRPEGQVEMLDVFSGTLEKVAADYETFVRLVNQQEWQETYLLSESVLALHKAGKVPGPGQCYALAPHPTFGGPTPARGEAVDPAVVMTMPIGAWQSLCVQFLHGVPAGEQE